MGQKPTYRYISRMAQIWKETFGDWPSASLESSELLYALAKNEKALERCMAEPALAEKIVQYIPGYIQRGLMMPVGSAGAGMGICPEEDLPEGMTPLDGYDDRSSANFGNYMFNDGSIMCFIPKFYYRINHPDNPTHAVYAPNDIHIVGIDTFSSRAEAALSGYALHRAFIDGGVEQSGFFFDKYTCSKNALGTGYVASSLAYGKPLSTSSTHNPIADLTACNENHHYEIVTAAHARDGENGAVAADSQFFATTQFQGSALAMLSLAHGQACTGAAHCAWFGSSHNYPKGCNDNALGDCDDSAVDYTTDGYSNCGKTGSGDPFSKTTHNGQACGVADLNGLIYEIRLGLTRPGVSADDDTTKDDASAFYVLKESVEARTLTSGWNGGNDTWGDAAHLATLYDQITLSHVSNDMVTCYGNGTNQVLNESLSGDGYKITSLGFPKDSSAKSSGGTDLFGNDQFREVHRANLCVLSCGHWYGTTYAGVFAYNLSRSRMDSSGYVGFRCACYPKKKS